MLRILLSSITVLGGGILGNALAEELSRDGNEVRLVSSRFPEPRHQSLNIERILGDASDGETLRVALNGADRLVIAFGGMRPHQAEQSPDENLQLTIGTLEAVISSARKAKLRSISYVSSGGAVYGESLNNHKFSEQDEPRPATAYGRAKLAAEKIMLHAEVNSQTKVQIFRVSNIFGDGDVRDPTFGFIEHAISAWRKGSEFVIFGDGEDQRDFIPVGVASRQISALLELDESPSVVNIARGTSHTLNEVIKMIEDNTNRSIAVAYRERRACDLRASRLDNSLLKSLTGFEVPSLQDQLSDIVKKSD